MQRNTASHSIQQKVDVNKYCSNTATTMQASLTITVVICTSNMIAETYGIFCSYFYPNDEYHQTQGKWNAQI